MYIYLFFPFLLTTGNVKSEGPPVSAWNTANERTLHGPVPSFLLSLPCPSEGYFRHPKYCSQFYRCVDIYGSKRALSLFQGTCEPGLVFDEKISSCNWPDLSPPCDGHETSQEVVHPQDYPPQSEITSRPDFPRPVDEKSEIVQQVFEVFTETYSTRPSFTTEKPSQQQVQTQQRVQEEQTWQQLMPEEVQQAKLEQVHQQQTQKEIQADQLQQQPEQQTQVQQVEQQVVQQQVQQQVQEEEQQNIYPQEAQLVQQPHETQQQELHQQQIQQQAEQQIQQQVAQHDQQGTFGSDWWVPDEEKAWTTKAVQHDVQNTVTNEELLCRGEGFFQHPGNCSKFYRCVRRTESFEVFVFECPQFLVFNQSASGCHRSHNQACVTNEAAYRSLRSKRSVSEPTGRLEASTLPCPEEGFFRHPRHCQVFYRCVKPQQRSRKFSVHTFVCPKNLVFDEKKGTCDWPEKSAPCSDNSVSISGSTLQPSRSTRQPLRTTRQPPRSTRQPLRSTRQPVRSTRPPRTTRQPLRTSRQPSLTTRQPSRTKQQNFSATRQPSSKQKSKNKNDRDQVLRRPTVPRPSDQVQRRPNIPRPSNQGRDKLKLTHSTERPRTQVPVITVPEVNCRAPGFFTNRSDCNKYYKCVDRSGKGQYFLRYDFACPQNLAFDEVTMTCKSPNRVAYCRRSQTHLAVLQDDDSQAETTSTASVSEESPKSEEQTSKSSSSSSSQGGNKECKKEGYFRDPQDCNKFYRCVDFNGDGKQFVRYDFSCPEGLVFDEENNVCNWPSSSAECNAEGGEGGESDNSRGEESESNSRDTPAPNETESPQTESSSTDSGDAPRSTEDSQSKSTTETTSEPVQTDSNSNESETESSTSGRDESTSQGTSSTASSSDIRCTEEGFFRHPDDCSKFYRCVDSKGDGKQFVRYDFSCPEGLEFDEVNSVCNWPSSDSPCSSSSSEDGGTQSPSSSSTSGTDSSSSSGTDSTTSTSGEERTEEEATESSDRDEISTQTESSGSDTSSSTSDTATSSTSDTTPSSASDTSTESGDSSESEGGEEATSESSASESGSTSDGSRPSSDSDCTEEGFFRNPDDCSKFYRCVDFNGDGKQFVRYDFECPEGLVFDEVNSVCNWPDMSPPCDSQPREPGQTTTAASSEGTTDSEKDSSSTSGQTATSTSSEGTTESATDAQSTTSETTTSTETETTKAQSETSTSSTQTSSSESQTTESSSSGTTSGEVSSECTEEGYFRDPEDCSKFHRCVDRNGDGQEFIRYDFQCPEGLVFDVVNTKCNWPEESPPCESGSEKEQTRETESTTKSGETDSTSESTDSGDESTTSRSSTTSSTQSEECTEEGYFRDPSDCRKYYRCIEKDDGTFEKRDFSCEEDEVFDPEKQFCDKKDLNPSCPDSTTEGTDTTETTAKSGTTSSSSTTFPPEESSTAEGVGTSSTSGSESSSTSKSSTKKECTEEGFFRDPDDCNKFYRCVDFRGDGKSFVRYDFECPEGLVFDEENQVCNWPSDVPECESSGSGEGTSSSQGETSSSSTTQTDSATTSSTASTASSTTSEEPTRSTGTDSSDTATTSATQGQTDTSSSSSQGETSSSSTTQTDSAATSSTASTASSTTSEEPTRSTGTDSSDTATTSATQGQTDTSSSSSSTSSSQSGNEDIQCTEEGFFRHPDDCAKFYRCVDFNGDGKQFVRYDFECPEGLVFDETLSVCNWPEDSPPCETGSDTPSDSSSSTESNSKESGQKSTTSSTEQGTTQDESSTTSSESAGRTTETTSNGATTTASETGGTTSSRTTTAEEGKESSESECKEEGFFRDPDDCRKYYRCLRNNETGELEKKEYDCPEGTIFDEEGRYCNAEELSPPCNSSGSFECTEEGFFRDPEDCTKYIQCTKRNDSDTYEQKRFQCPKDHVFDEEGRYCNAKELSPPCDDDGEDESSTTSGETTSKGPQEGGGSTTSGETTSEGPQEGGGTTTSEETTSEGQTDGDQSSSSDSFECKEEGFFRDPEDCTKYYQCSKRNDSSGMYEKKKHSCPEDHVFDEEGRYCNSVDLAPPCDESETSETTSGESSSTQGRTTGSSTEKEKTKTETTDSEGADSTTEASSKTSSSSSSSRSPGQRKQECKEEGFFRNPDDCNKFYRCVDFSGSGESFVRYDFECPEGLVFDEINSVCTWPTISPPCENKQDDSETLRHLPPAE